jgi:hypothetical protein
VRAILEKQVVQAAVHLSKVRGVPVLLIKVMQVVMALVVMVKVAVAVLARLVQMELVALVVTGVTV